MIILIKSDGYKWASIAFSDYLDPHLYETTSQSMISFISLSLYYNISVLKIVFV